MCRIAGISYGGDLERLSTAQIAKALGEALVSGGPHAFGFMQKVGDEVTTRKFPGRIDQQFSKLFSIKRDCDWFVLHTRFATHGDSSNLNNVHPIRHGNILGVHNGVLRNHDAILRQTGRYVKDTQVDSEAIMAAVNRWGHKDGLARIYGSMVTVYTDLRSPHKLYIARSNSRALRLGWTVRGNLIWASEQHALDKLADLGIEFLKFSGISENRLLVIENGDIRERATYRPVPLTSIRTTMTLVPPAPQGQQSVANFANIPPYSERVAMRRGAALFDPNHRNNGYTEPLPQNQKRPVPRKKKGKKAPALVQEVGIIVGPNLMAYKGMRMSTEEYISVRSRELAEAVLGKAKAGMTSDEILEELKEDARNWE